MNIFRCLGSKQLIFLVCSKPPTPEPGGNPMRWILLAATAALVATLWLPAEAAQPAVPAAVAGDPISFEQYPHWPLAFIALRPNDLRRPLAARRLPAPRQAPLQQK